MEAPEKIYISNVPSELGGYKYITCDKNFPHAVEYTRTDAFIEKACELLVNCIEDFMARRLEIWDEESKKKTLENLRNALKE